MYEIDAYPALWEIWIAKICSDIFGWGIVVLTTCQQIEWPFTSVSCHMDSG
jgi:hypothetical protein